MKKGDFAAGTIAERSVYLYSTRLCFAVCVRAGGGLRACVRVCVRSPPGIEHTLFLLCTITAGQPPHPPHVAIGLSGGEGQAASAPRSLQLAPNHCTACMARWCGGLKSWDKGRALVSTRSRPWSGSSASSDSTLSRYITVAVSASSVQSGCEERLYRLAVYRVCIYSG